MNKREAKSAAKRLLVQCHEAIVASLETIDGLTRRFERETSVERVSIGRQLSVIRYEVAPDLDADWRELIRNEVEGESVQTLYRWTNAGTVARIIGDTGTIGLVGNLVPLYRLLDGVKSDEDRDAAHSLIREVWNEACEAAGPDTPPAVDDVTARAEKVAPSKRSGGSKKETDESDDSEESDESDEERRESAEETVTVNAETVANVAANVAAFVHKAEKDYGIAPESCKAIMAWTALLAKENTTPNHNGADVILAALKA